jgi:hypothetical protein
VGTAEEPPPAGRVTDETDYFRFADQRGVRLDWKRGLGKACLMELSWLAGHS